MNPISSSEMQQLQSLALLEYQVSDGRLTRTKALERKYAQPLQLRSADDAAFEMLPGGYPTLQSCWDLMKAGIMQAPMPREK